MAIVGNDSSKGKTVVTTKFAKAPKCDTLSQALKSVFGCTGKKERKSDCGEWQWSVCVANEGDCGLGTREGTRTGTDCKQTIKTQRCKIPCNWKKKFGGEAGMCSLTTVLR